MRATYRSSVVALLIGAAVGCGGDITNDGRAGASGGGMTRGGSPSALAAGGTAATTGGWPGSGGAPATGGVGPTGGAAEPCGVVVPGHGVECPPVYEFVVDISESMTEQAYPGTTDPASKWDELRRALRGLWEMMPADWGIGVTYFNLTDLASGTPTCFEGQTDVPVAPITTAHQSAINDSLDSITVSSSPSRLGGYAPLQAAWRYALSEVTRAYPPPFCADAARIIVLVTDGVPGVLSDGCTIQQPISQAEYDAFIETLRSESEPAAVWTIVVGVPGSQDGQGADFDPRYYLSLLADAGRTGRPGCTPVPGTLQGDGTYQNGTYCHVDLAQNPSSLASIADYISYTGGPRPCSLMSPAVPEDGRVYDYGNMQATYTLTGRRLTQSTDSCQTGDWYIEWLYDADGTPYVDFVTLCANTCEQWLNDGVPTIEFAISCA
jgi:hypothetical protein